MNNSACVRVALLGTVVLCICLSRLHHAAQPDSTPARKPTENSDVNATTKEKGKVTATEQRLPPRLKFAAAPLGLREQGHQLDFPDVARAADGSLWLNYIDHDGNHDVPEVGLGARVMISPRSRRSAIPESSTNRRWQLTETARSGVSWGQTGDDDVVHLHARAFQDGKLGPVEIIAHSAGSDSFADAGTDSAGRVWVTWQSDALRRRRHFCALLRPRSTGNGPRKLRSLSSRAGDWEPRIAFDASDTAWILYDCSRGNEFNLYLSRVDLEGNVETHRIAHSPRYEGRFRHRGRRRRRRVLAGRRTRQDPLGSGRART